MQDADNAIDANECTDQVPIVHTEGKKTQEYVPTIGPPTPLMYGFLFVFKKRKHVIGQQGTDSSHPLAVVEQHANALAVVDTANRLGEHIAYFKHFQFRASGLVVSLVDRVGHYDFVQGAGVDAIDCIAAENAVRDERKHLCRAFLLQQLRRARDGIRGVRKIVDEDSGAICDVSDQHHGCILSVVDLCRTSLLVDEGKGHAEGVGDCSCTFGTSSVWTDYDGLLVVGDVELDVFAEEMATVQVVNGNVEETLVLRVCGLSAWFMVSKHTRHTMEIHRNNVVCASACEKVCNQRAGLSDPLAIPDHGLERGWFCG
jgi:hypothetical protein